jgi:hypothetical protein
VAELSTESCEENWGLLDAAERANHGNVTWLTSGGERIAAIVPPDVARAWLDMRADLEEAQRIAAQLGEMARIFRGERQPEVPDG